MDGMIDGLVGNLWMYCLDKSMDSDRFIGIMFIHICLIYDVTNYPLIARIERRMDLVIDRLIDGLAKGNSPSVSISFPMESNFSLLLGGLYGILRQLCWIFV